MSADKLSELTDAKISDDGERFSFDFKSADGTIPVTLAAEQAHILMAALLHHTIKAQEQRGRIAGEAIVNDIGWDLVDCEGAAIANRPDHHTVRIDAQTPLGVLSYHFIASTEQMEKLAAGIMGYVAGFERLKQQHQTKLLH